MFYPFPSKWLHSAATYPNRPLNVAQYREVDSLICKRMKLMRFALCKTDFEKKKTTEVHLVYKIIDQIVIWPAQPLLCLDFPHHQLKQSFTNIKSQLAVTLFENRHIGCDTVCYIIYYAYFILLKECMFTNTSLELNTTKSKVTVIGTIQILTYWWTHCKQLTTI